MKMKNKLIVLYEENKNNPKNTWSGTSYQLREALKEYFDVIFIDSSDVFLLRIIKMISKRIEKKTASYIIKPIYEKLHEIEINYRLRQYKDIPVLEIAENVIVHNDFYLYRDMSYACYPYVLDKLKNDKNDYGPGMLNSVSKKALNRRIEREELFHKKCKGEFYMGHWVTNLMKEYYPEYANKFIYAGGGLNSEFNLSTTKNKKDDIKRILFVGIDFKRKGGNILLKAFNLLREKYGEKIELLIVGPNIIKEDNGVKYLGNLSREKISELFSLCDIYCMPSRFEAYGLVFIEALSYGLPIVAYNDFEMSHFVQNGKNGYLIDKYSEEELFNALVNTINDESIFDYCKNKQMEYIGYYSWKNTSNNIYGFIVEGKM